MDKEAKAPLLMKFFIGSESIFFIALIMSFLYFKSFDGFGSGVEKLSAGTTGIYSVFLILSSLTFYLTERSHRKGHIGSLKIWLIATIILGVVFMYGQLSEYSKLIGEGLTVDENVFGTNFYTLTGFHGFHVTLGLIALCICLALAFSGDFDKKDNTVLRSMGVYWHFVDAVWIVVFSVVYLLPLLNT